MLDRTADRAPHAEWVLLVLHGTSGFNDTCAPTLGMTTGDYEGFDSDLGILMALYASFGFVTVFPDYIGLKSLGGPTGFMHPYLVAEPTAIASLDAVRAASKLLATTGTSTGDVVVLGGSQGGHAAAFVNRYAPHYAPEMTIRGSVWDVPPTDMMEQTRAAWGDTWVNASDNAIAFFTAAQTWYGSAPGGLSEIFLPPYDTQVPQSFLRRAPANRRVQPRPSYRYEHSEHYRDRIKQLVAAQLPKCPLQNKCSDFHFVSRSCRTIEIGRVATVVGTPDRARKRAPLRWARARPERD